MARHEHEREDLLGEATALVERVSLRIDGWQDDVLVGFRRDSSASLYLGQRLVYQFNSAGQLRRAHDGDVLLKAERGRLVALRRARSDSAVELVRHTLNESEEHAFIKEMREQLGRLERALVQGGFTILGQVPENADVGGRIRDWLDRFGAQVRIANSPRAG